MKLYRFDLLFFDGAVITGYIMCLGTSYLSICVISRSVRVLNIVMIIAMFDRHISDLSTLMCLSPVHFPCASHCSRCLILPPPPLPPVERSRDGQG